MATNAPSHPCPICGGKLEWEVVPVVRQPWEAPRFGVTDWRQLPHTCPPGAAERYYAAAIERGLPRPSNKERLLIVANSLEGFYHDLIKETGLHDVSKNVADDVKTLREVAQLICPDGCDGG